MRGNEFEIDMIAVNALCESVKFNHMVEMNKKCGKSGDSVAAIEYNQRAYVCTARMIEKANRIIALREMV